MYKFIDKDRVVIHSTHDTELDGVTGTILGTYGSDASPSYIVKLDILYSKIPDWSTHMIVGSCLSKI